MKIRDFLTGPISFAAAALLAALLFLVAPPAATGQWIPTDTEFVRGETPVLFSDTVWEAAPFALVSPPASSNAERLTTLPLSSSTPVPPLIMEEESLRKRLLPYALAGAVLGGVAGFLYRDKIDGRPTDEDWGVGYVAYPALGAGIGFWAGFLVGYLRERP